MINTSFLTGIGTIVAQVSGIVVAKTIAVTFGSAGVAMISQFIDFITVSTSVATGGIQYGVVKYVAEFKREKSKLAEILSTSLRITLIFTLLIGSLIFGFSSYLSNYLFRSCAYTDVLKIFSANIFLFGLNTLFIKILNGLGDIKKLVLVTISNSLFGLFLTSTAAIFLGLKAALVALSVSQSFVLFLTLIIIRRSQWFEKSLFSLNLDRLNVFRLLNFALMGVCMMVLGPVVNLGIRNYVIQNLTIHDAGIWSGLLKISNSYLGIITLTLSYYYLPKFSFLKEKELIRQEIISGLKIILPILFFLISVIFIFREFLILLIYTKDFLEMESLFAVQLLGDFFKISSFIFSYLMLAKARTKLFIVTSILFSIITYFLSIFLIDMVGLYGIVYAHAIIYFIYLLTMVYFFRDYLYE